MNKKLLCWLLILILILSSFAAVPLSADAAQTDLAAAGEKSGTTGDCTWTFDGSVLTISGNGAMADYASGLDHKAPWDFPHLTEVVIEDGVTNIGDYAFNSDYSLKKVTIPNSVTRIGSHTFTFCREMAQIDIPDSVLSIGEHALSGCRALTSVKLPVSLTAIDRCLFYGCLNLKRVSIPAGVTSIGDYAFYNCPSLKNITIPFSVKSIGEYAFRDCTGLTAVTIPAGVTDIGDYALGYKSYTAIEGFTIYGAKGSAAELYAKKNKISFMEGAAPPPQELLGDVDDDGEVAILDATAIQRWLADLPTASFYEPVADVDRDAEIAILDVTAIQRWLANLPTCMGIGTLQYVGVG